MDRDEADRDDAKQEESGLEPKHKIFLSHSGAQKSFVEALCVQLEGVRRFPFFDRRTDCLPWGERFPGAILAAARQCQVAVVVLSEEYFTRSKWPMIELVVFMQQPESSIKIIPLFFKISLSQLRDPERQRRWVSVWEAWAAADPRIKLSEWKAALKRLPSFTGLEYVVQRGADSSDLEKSLKEYRDKVVEALVESVDPDVLHGENAGDIQGRRRICQEILAKFKKPDGSTGARVVGLYGMGGIGKTTFCKLLCNDLEKEFLGKVCHVELGHQTTDDVELLKLVVLSLTNTADSRGFHLWTMSQCLDYLMKEVRRKPTFLALDNVSPESLDLALVFLQLGFHEKSMVLVTAHTVDILASHLKIDSSNCIEMPHLTKDEATKLFLKHAARGNPSLKDEGDYDFTIQQCVKECYFSKGDEQAGHHYHPLALLVLGEQLQSKEFSKWWEILQEEPDKFNLLRNRTHPVFSVLYRSYSSLLEEDRLMFMDVALFTPERCFLVKAPGDVISWLSLVHALNSTQVRNRLELLRTRGMVDDFDAHSSSIGMHELFRELAQMEAKAKDLDSRTCVYETRSLFELQKRRLGDFCPNLSRFALANRDNSFCTLEDFENIRWNYFSNLVVLKLFQCDISHDDLNLKELKVLRSLEVCACWSLTQLPGLRELKNLTYLRLAHVPVCKQTLDQQLPVSLQHLHLQGLMKLISPPNLDHCSSLLELTVELCVELYQFPDLSKLTSLQKVLFASCGFQASVVRGLNSSLSRLESLRVFGSKEQAISCPNLDTVATRLENLQLVHMDATELDFHKFTCLKQLAISTSKLRKVSGLENLTKLRAMDFKGCSALPALDNVRRLPALQVLNLQGCGNLRSLKVYDCGKLSTCLGFSDLTALEELHLWNVGVEEIPDPIELYLRNVGLSLNPEPQAQQPNFGRLRILSLRGCTELESLENMGSLPALQSLDTFGCSKLEELPDVRSSRALESLDVSQTAVHLRFRDVYNLASMPALSPILRSVKKEALPPEPPARQRRTKRRRDRQFCGLDFETYNKMHVYFIIQRSRGEFDEIQGYRMMRSLQQQHHHQNLPN